jgi:hypothetical protein
MKSLFLCLSILTCNHCFAQIDPDDTTIFRQIISHIRRSDPIVYVTNVPGRRIPHDSNTFVQHGLNTFIQRGIVFSFTKEDSLLLTKTEDQYLRKQLSKKTKWPEELFRGSKGIPMDSMWSYLEQQGVIKYEKIKKADSTRDMAAINKLQRLYSYVFVFTKPIYIRNKTICLVSYAAMCGGDCGINGVTIYKKENNRWAEWIEVESGAF